MGGGIEALGARGQLARIFKGSNGATSLTLLALGDTINKKRKSYRKLSYKSDAFIIIAAAPFAIENIATKNVAMPSITSPTFT